MPKADALLPIVRASDSDTSFFICIVFLWFFRPSIVGTVNEGCMNSLQLFASIHSRRNACRQAISTHTAIYFHIPPCQPAIAFRQRSASLKLFCNGETPHGFRATSPRGGCSSSSLLQFLHSC